MGERGREGEGPTDDGGGALASWAPADLRPIASRERRVEREKEPGGNATGLQMPMGGATKAGEPAAVELGSGSHQKQQR